MTAAPQRNFIHTPQHQQKNAYAISEGIQDPRVFNTIRQMLDHCQRRPMDAPFKATGVIIDTRNDIEKQVRDFFPAQIDITPVIDRIVFVCGQRAQDTGQPVQMLSFDHLKRIEPKDAVAANQDVFMEVFPDKRMKISAFQTMQDELKMIGAGGGSADASNLVAYLRQHEVEGFGLFVKSIDLSNERAMDLMKNTPIGQALGASPAAVASAVETYAQGGMPAQNLQGVIQQIIDIKTIRAELLNNNATATAAALAVKTESLASDLNALQTQAPIQAAIADTIQTVRTDLTARQVEIVVNALAPQIDTPAPVAVSVSAAAPAQPAQTISAPQTFAQTPASSPAPVQQSIAPQTQPSVHFAPQTPTQAPAFAPAPAQQTPAQFQNTAPAQPAQTASAPQAAPSLPPQIIEAIQEIQRIVNAQQIPVRDAVTLTLSNQAPKEMAAAVQKMMQVMADPAFVPAIAPVLPPAVVTQVQTIVTQPALQSAAQTPIQISETAQIVRGLVKDLPNALPIAKELTALISLQAANDNPQSILQAPMLEKIQLNLQALTLSENTPPHLLPKLEVAVAQIEALTTQVRADGTVVKRKSAWDYDITPDARPDHDQPRRKGKEEQIQWNWDSQEPEKKAPQWKPATMDDNNWKPAQNDSFNKSPAIKPMEETPAVKEEKKAVSPSGKGGKCANCFAQACANCGAGVMSAMYAGTGLKPPTPAMA